MSMWVRYAISHSCLGICYRWGGSTHRPAHSFISLSRFSCIGKGNLPVKKYTVLPSADSSCLDKLTQGRMEMFALAASTPFLFIIPKPHKFETLFRVIIIATLAHSAMLAGSSHVKTAHSRASPTICRTPAACAFRSCTPTLALPSISMVSPRAGPHGR